MTHCMWARACQFTVNEFLPCTTSFPFPPTAACQGRTAAAGGRPGIPAREQELWNTGASWESEICSSCCCSASSERTEMDAGGSTKRSRPVRRATKKLKFKPKVPPQKPRKLITEKAEQEPPVPIDEELIKILRTPQKAAKTLPKAKEECSKQSPPQAAPSASVISLSPPQPGVYKQNHSTTLQSPRAFPITVTSGVLYNKEEEEYDDDEDDDDDDDDVEFQENQQSSTECEASTHPAEELGLLQEKERKERMLLFQLPKTLPLPRRPSIVETKGKAASREVKVGSNLQQLPQGYLGKMLVYKSGKIKMKIGDVMFDVNPGPESRMVQHAVAVNSKEKHCCLLGEIENRHVIVTPDVDSLLNNN